MLYCSMVNHGRTDKFSSFFSASLNVFFQCRTQMYFCGQFDYVGRAYARFLLAQEKRTALPALGVNVSSRIQTLVSNTMITMIGSPSRCHGGSMLGPSKHPVALPLEMVANKMMSALCLTVVGARTGSVWLPSVHTGSGG